METKKVSAKQFASAITGAAFLTLLDQLTNIWAIHSLKDQPPVIWIQGVFELLYLENRGAAFGLMQNQKWLFLISVFLVLCVSGYFFYRMSPDRHYTPLRLIAVFISAGAIGNMIDRIARGYVVDFFYFSLIDFPVFNVADIYVTVSAVCFILLFLFYYKEEDFQFLSKK